MARGAVRERVAARHAGAQVEGEEGFALSGIAVHQAELAAGEASRPQPGERPDRQVLETDHAWVGHGCGSEEREEEVIALSSRFLRWTAARSASGR